MLSFYMTVQDLKLPDSIPELQEMILELYKNKIQNEAQISYLQDQIKMLSLRQFGPKSERFVPENPDQRSLFDEPEDTVSRDASEEEDVEIKSYTRKKPGRRPLPDHLPRKEVVHDLPDDEKVCACGCQLKQSGQDQSEELEFTPPEFKVIRHIRLKYVCKNCEGVESEDGAVKTAPAPLKLIPKSISTPSLLAAIITGKFVDSIPFYRQEKQFSRHGVDISRTSMCNWALKIWEKCKPLEKLLRQEVLSGPLIHTDETPFQVLFEDGREAKDKSYMWLLCGGPPDAGVVYYKYAPSRGRAVVEELLDGYKGYVVTGGYVSYDYLDELPGVTHVACWAHVRRKFMDVAKIAGKKKTDGKAQKALRLIKALYNVEAQAKIENLSSTQLQERRQRESKETIEAFDALVQDNVTKALAKTYFGKAIIYSARQLPRLKHFLEDGIVPLDNNRIENAIRPFAVGRKNWLFAHHAEGASASAFFYSIVETAKANSLEPYSYLIFLFEKLPLAETEEDFKNLLPMYVDTSQIKKLKKES